MLIGARTAAWSGGGGWTNPYITDGLVAMWDGEWNAGGGVHDPSASAPLDLFDGATVPATWHGDIVMTDNSFRCLSGSYLLGGTADLSQWDGLTLEIALRNNGSDFPYLERNSTPFGWVYCGTGFSHRRRFGFQTGNDFRAMLYFSDGDNYIQLDSFTYIRGRNVTRGLISYSVSDGNAFVANNGVVISSSANGALVNPTAAFVYRNTNGTAGTDETEVYSMRVYNRALTAAEIAANYAVDKARFNLP